MDKKKLVAKKMTDKEQAEFDQGYVDRRSADKSFSVLNPYYLSDKIEDLTASGSIMRKAGKTLYDNENKTVKKAAGGRVGKSYRGYGAARCN
jgi:hypothetical protein